MAMSMTIT